MRIRTLLNPFSCQQRYEKQDWSKVFPNFNNMLDVEIGFGSGSFLENYAKLNPSRSMVGFEIRGTLVNKAQEKMLAQKIENTFLVLGNGQHGLTDMFDDHSIDRLFIFHPDPWIKRHHQRRRVISNTFLETIQQKLKPGSCLYLATDVPELWEAMLKSIEDTKNFTHIPDEEFWTTLYQTRWKERSLEHKRSLFYGTFQVRI